MEQIVGVAQLYFMPHPLLEIVQRLMAHPVDGIFEAFQKASIWKSAIGFEIGALLVCNSHASESPV